MDIRRLKAEAAAKKYMRTDALLKDLGSGAEGFVFPSHVSTAIKVFTYEEKFERELAAYKRLHRRKVFDVLGLAIPRLINSDSSSLVIEMTIVQPPYLLDFAQAAIDKPFDFQEGGEQEWWERVEQNFGERFELARDVFYALQRSTGIYYYDLAPRNMNFSQYPV